MPEVATVPETPAWISQLPGDLQQNQSLTSFKTIGDLAKAHLDSTGKITELTGKLGNSIPKLPDNATDEQRSQYYDALGRPKTASEYEFEGEDKNAPEWTNFWKSEFHKAGIPKQQAKTLSTLWNGQMQKMVEAYNTQRQQEMAAAEQKLRTEMGAQFEANVELAKRMYSKHLGGEFDKEFANADPASRFSTLRLLLKVAALTGEDRSPQGGNTGPSGNGKQVTFIAYDKSPVMAKKR